MAPSGSALPALQGLPHDHLRLRLPPRFQLPFTPVLALVAAVLLSPGLVERAGSEPLFPGALLTTVRAGWSAFAVGDVNADGLLDLVVANNASNAVAVMLGDGNGTFAVGVDYATGIGPSSVAIGDLNADGNTDLVTGSAFDYSESSVSVLLGNGDGSFGAHVEYGTGYIPYSSVVIADLNGDQVMDIVTANKSHSYSYPKASVLLGQGDGTFGPVAHYGSGGASSLLIGDFNGDGNVDLVTTGSGAVVTLLGSGDGTFNYSSGYATSATSLLAIGDIDGDGDLDLLLEEGPSVSALWGNGDGTWGAKTDFVLPRRLYGQYSSSATIGDLNADGQLDLVASNSDYTASVLLNMGGGTLLPSADYATGLRLGRPTIRDLNRDGALDVLLAGERTVSVLLGSTDGTLKAATVYGSGSGRSVAIGDLDGNGKLDLATAGPAGVSIFLGNGTGAFGTSVDYLTGYQANSVAVGDVTGDENPDLVTANAGGTLSILSGNGDGTFVASCDHRADTGSVGIADMSGDGLPDLVTAHFSTVSVLLGEDFNTRASFPTAEYPTSFAIEDVNGDGVSDLVTCGTGVGYGGTVSVLLGNGDGTLAPHVDYGVGGLPISVVVGDLNRDGRLDIAAADRASNGVSVLLGNGDGTFGQSTIYPTGSSPQSLAVGDVNGDGAADVVTAGDVISILLGNGDGTFGPTTDYVTGYPPSSLAIGDLNADGKLDLVTAGSVLLNMGRDVSPEISVVVQSVQAEAGSVRLGWTVLNAVNAITTVQRRNEVDAWIDLGAAEFESGTSARYEDKTVRAGERYAYRLFTEGAGGRIYSAEIWVLVPSDATKPLELRLDPSRPNPFRTGTRFSFTTPQSATVRLEIYDISGRRVATVVNRELPPGRHSMAWNGRDSTGRLVASGIYFAKLEANREIRARKLLVER